MSQGQLFDGYGAPRPGRIRVPALVEAKPCAVEGCDKPRRRVQAARYCDEHATSRDYEPTGLAAAECYVCGIPIMGRSGRRAISCCQDHQHLRSTLASWRTRHRVDRDRARKWLDDPRCWICERSLAWRFAPGWGIATNPRAVVVDHDHGCCPGAVSCGRCVRGLAHDSCNRRIGFLETMLSDIGTERTLALVAALVRRES